VSGRPLDPDVWVSRSRLDPEVWVPWYGGDQSCAAWAGKLRAVKRHVETTCTGWDAAMTWYRRDRDTWWYLTAADAAVVRKAAQGLGDPGVAGRDAV
jgi:hypothetical protein